MKTLWFLIFFVSLTGTALGTPSQLPAGTLSALANARRATARYHRVEQAEAEGLHQSQLL